MDILSHLTFNPYAVVSLLLITTAVAIAFTAVGSIRSTSNQRSNAATTHNTDEGDYDFLATAESIPSQYDIAIAFLATGQIEKAIAILRKVINSNHPIYSGKAHEKISQLNVAAS